MKMALPLQFTRGLVCGLTLLTLAACSTSEEILPGERIAIIDREADLGLEVDNAANAEGAGLGPALVNTAFPTPGYGDGHAGGHLALDLPLELAFSLKGGCQGGRGQRAGPACRR